MFLHMIQFLSVEYSLLEQERCPAFVNLPDFFALSKNIFLSPRLFSFQIPHWVYMYVCIVHFSFQIPCVRRKGFLPII